MRYFSPRHSLRGGTRLAMIARGFHDKYRIPHAAPIALLITLTGLIFLLAGSVHDGWTIEAIMFVSLLLGVCLVTRLYEEKKTRRQTAQFNTALCVSHMALWVRDFNSGSIEWTASIDGMVEQDDGEFPRTIFGWLSAIHTEDQPHVRVALESSRSAGTPFDVEYRLMKGLGGFIWVSDVGNAPFKGQRVGIMHGAIRDITQQKRSAEKALRLEGQLRQAQKSEAIGTLAGGIAHDFNNLLTGIIGNTQLVLLDIAESGEGKQYRAQLDTVLRAGARATALVKQILTFSRQTVNVMAPVSLGPIVEEVTSFIRSTVPANIDIVATISPDIPIIMANASNIHQVLVNLCTNGIHAMKETNGRLVLVADPFEADAEFVKLHPDLRAGAHVHLSVSDTGHGMDSNTLKQIFDPFFTTKRPGEGTGLGLAIVHGIVREHGGGIYCHSHAGEGSTFHVYLPAMSGNARWQVPEDDPAFLATHHEHVLLIDDENDSKHTTAAMLERLGYNVTSVSDGDAAVTKFEADPASFHLVLTDLAMPNGTGLELARRLLRIRPAIPIALMTGFAGNLTDESLRKIGIRTLILKPLSMERLGYAVRKVIDEQANAERFNDSPTPTTRSEDPSARDRDRLI